MRHSTFLVERVFLDPIGCHELVEPRVCVTENYLLDLIDLASSTALHCFLFLYFFEFFFGDLWMGETRGASREPRGPGEASGFSGCERP